MELAIVIEGACSLNWSRWKRLVREINQMDFVGLYRSDHFTVPWPPDLDSLELIVSLTYLASHSQNLHFGPMVSPLSFRDPIMLARQAMALDDLSGGRMILGVGAGWAEREHTMFGYKLGDVATRMDRLAEGLEVMTQLIRSDEPVTFQGQFYQLHEAQLLPRPQRTTPVLVGGNGPKRTLPMVARYADIWNCQVASPQLFQERSALLDNLLHAENRKPGDVKRTLMVPVICWQDQPERERRMNLLRSTMPYFAPMSTEDLIDWIRSNMAGVVGTSEQISEQLNEYDTVGVEELIIQWIGVDDLEGLAILAERIVPHFPAKL